MKMSVKFLHLLLVLYGMTACNSSKQKGYMDLMNRLRTNFLKLGLKTNSSATPPFIDLVFMIDESSCMGKENYVMTLRFLKKLLDFFSISPGTTRVGVVTYSDIALTQFTFEEYSNRVAVQKRLLKLSETYAGKESTFLGKALSASSELFTDFTRPGTQRILVAVTNGVAGNNNDTKEIKTSVGTLDKLGVLRYVFTIGKTIHATNIETIISKPKSYAGPQIFHFIFKSVEAIRWVSNLLPKGHYVFCNKPGIWRDECRMRCECVNGRLVNCQRVRQEIMSLSVADRTRFIETYKKLTSVEPYKSRYNSFIAIHSRYFFDGIHTPLQFLPWHRWFIMSMENLLFSVDCRVTYPYWNWALVSGDPFNQTLLFGDRPDGLGTNGDINDPDFCVLDGPFGKNTGWRTQTGTCLQRDFFSGVPDLPLVMQVLAEPNFELFEIKLRVNLHDVVHCAIGGIMCSAESATVPEFFLHHGYVDKLWLEKQKQSEEAKQGIFNPTNGPKIQLTATGYTAEKFLDNERLPGYVNVSYDEPVALNGRRVMEFCHKQSITELLSMRRRGNFPVYSETAAKKFKMSEYDMKMAREFAKECMAILATHRLLEPLTGEDHFLGFKLPNEFKTPYEP